MARLRVQEVGKGSKCSRGRSGEVGVAPRGWGPSRVVASFWASWGCMAWSGERICIRDVCRRRVEWGVTSICVV
eukprot:6508732-Pyramimonas_sp.AAC.1